MDGDSVGGRMEWFVRRQKWSKRRRIVRDSVVRAEAEVILRVGTACSSVGLAAAEANCAESGRSYAGKVRGARVIHRLELPWIKGYINDYPCTLWITSEHDFGYPKPSLRNYGGT